MRASITIVLFGVVATACTSPAPMTDAATTTSDSLGIVQRELERFSSKSRRQAEITSERIATIQRGNRGLRDELAETVVLYRAIGEEWVGAFDSLRAAADAYAKVDAASVAANEKLINELRAARVNLIVPSQTLSEAAIRYAKLAEPSSVSSQFSFLQQYARCTAHGVQLARDTAAGKTGDDLPKRPAFCNDFSRDEPPAQ